MTPFLFFVEPTEAEFGPIRFEFATKFMIFTEFTLATFDPSGGEQCELRELV